MKLYSIYAIIILLYCPLNAFGRRWSVEKAKLWYQQHGWQVGCNFIPSTAVNVLEMWQPDTFDMATIDRELGWAQSIGFNFVRVFLHSLLWSADAVGFKEHLEVFLQLAHGHNIKTMFVLFDDVWNGYPQLGPQPDPIPGVHNSRWVKCPGFHEVFNTSLYQYPVFEGYVKDILSTYANDSRVIMWDLYNEPGGDGLYNGSLALINKVFEWAREIDPSQPLTTPLYNDDPGFKNFSDFQIANSDVLSFHEYGDRPSMVNRIKRMQDMAQGRPIICTEYLARDLGSNFETHLPLMKAANISAVNWGFVDGRTQTIYPWDSWQHPYKLPPRIWHHEILNRYGSPFNATEIEIIKNLTA